MDINSSVLLIKEYMLGKMKNADEHHQESCFIQGAVYACALEEL